MLVFLTAVGIALIVYGSMHDTGIKELLWSPAEKIRYKAIMAKIHKKRERTIIFGTLSFY